MKLDVKSISVKGDSHELCEDAILTDRRKKIFAVADGVTIPSGGGEAARRAVIYLREVYRGKRNLFARIRVLAWNMDQSANQTLLSGYYNRL